MRSSFTAALTASIVLTMSSTVFAQTAQQSSGKSNVTAPSRDATETDVITPGQENTIPYHPCSLALGWVNGQLQCRNN